MAGRSTDVASAFRGFAVTKSDATIFSATRALYVGGTGDIAVVFAGNSTAVTLKAVPVGILPVQVTMVMSTNTTATDIVGLY